MISLRKSELGKSESESIAGIEAPTWLILLYHAGNEDEGDAR
jgi:hypothetical protein